mmetsp:Transcript_20598/g.44743  ORF Transcript_20598/g.44743 Transcript_20598/m.44743 type:complete len:225 (+) Transcript_20598:137-811(+)|eukprot:CAMPEP_0172312654 /NCGR_PEP_ID=MMETSP1058-20130122/18255_1 /TAXON_ID=83371 /ORGANISM="Detonula confervacea, Strain CCMP 353" /LENGTH=224 /DNA_ID=CAMNT_0013026177 /DNA_START=126 /DNA_END=800 /DNA_ORIENTATION=-
MGASKILLPVLIVAIAIFVATIGPSFLANESSILMSEQSVNIDGMPFPSDIKIAGSKQVLCGGGTRSKWGFRVYAVGIYSDLKIVKSLRKKYGNVVDANLVRDFSESKQARTLLLRFHREVATSDMSDALGDALIDRVGEDASKKFSTFILDMVGGDRLKVGSSLYITCKGEKLLASLTEGKATDTISIKGLCSAIFTVYLGDSPVSPQAKEGFEKGFADLIVS